MSVYTYAYIYAYIHKFKVIFTFIAKLIHTITIHIFYDNNFMLAK